MAVTLTAANAPAPVVPSPGVLLSDSNAPPVSDQFATGMAAGFTTSLNKQFKRSDLMGSYGAGAYAIGDGLTLTAGSGLTVNIAAGHAVIDGVVERSATTTTAGDNTTAWIWLKQDATIVVQNGTTAKPSGNCVLLGAAITSGGSISSIETAGVVYYKSGITWRETADVEVPTDTPNANIRIWTKTAGGDYFWNGTSYVEAVPAGSPRTIRTSVAYTALSTAATQNTIEIFNLPAKAVVSNLIGRVGTAFAGGSVSALAMDIGNASVATQFIHGYDALTAGFDSGAGMVVESFTATSSIKMRLTSTGDDLDALTAGSASFALTYHLAE